MAETAAVRPGEELDLERLADYLASTLSEYSGTIGVSQFPAGSSNLTYLMSIGDAEFVLRRPPFGNTVKTAHDMRREFDVLSKLSAVYPAAPRPLLFCEDVTVIGSEFYLMERREGIVIRGDLATDNMGEANAEKFRNDASFQTDVCAGFMQKLVELHSVDIVSAGLEELGRPEGYNRRQVEGWTNRYRAAQTHEWPELEYCISWLGEDIPTESGTAIVHNDYKFDNVMFDPSDLTKVTAVLDWEMVTIGDPLMDLGTTLGYWMSFDAGREMLSMPFNPRVLMETISRRQLADMYANAAGRDLPALLFYYVFGTFKIAVIAQQIYTRFVKGATSDPRFAHFDKFVEALGKIAARGIERGTI